MDYEKIRIELSEEKKLIQYADSVNKSGHVGTLNNEVNKIIETLDNQHPLMFFQKAATYLRLLQLNEAAFLYYTGYLRYKYYNSTNPDYEIGNDGALLASFMATLQEPLTRYLRTNIDNYIEILKKSNDWHLDHDYTFFSRTKNPEKYLEQSNKIRSLIQELETNKLNLQTEWAEEHAAYLNDLDSAIAHIATVSSSNGQLQTSNHPMARQEAAYLNSDSLMFCGQKIKSPTGCQMVMPGLVTCSAFAMTWTYQPIEDMDRHKKAGINRMRNPIKFDAYVVGTMVTAYQAKLDGGVQIQVYEVIKEQGLLLSIYILDKKKISADDDLPGFIRQVFKLSRN